MINQRDVIRMKIPYPHISSELAVASHMYICKGANGTLYEYVKCQTLKPRMLTSTLLKHFVDEVADSSRNPFQRTTRIDCDKLFSTKSVQYDDSLKTTIRPDVCPELYSKVITELSSDGYAVINLNEDELSLCSQSDDNKNLKHRKYQFSQSQFTNLCFT